MKLKVIINSCIIVMCFAFFSCLQEEEVYSCDKDVNAWVKENLADIQQMTREDWLRLDESVNRAAYVAFKPEQKQKFWLQKLQEVLSLDWNELEKAHIKDFYQEILDNQQWFLDDFSKNESDFEKFEIFIFKWKEYAEVNFGWDKNIMGSIIASGNKLLDTTGKMQINITSSLRLKNGSEPTCDCNTSRGNQFNECNSQYKHCSTKSGCIEYSWGCGFIYLEKCNGLCKDN
jgi:hypothetical protein